MGKIWSFLNVYRGGVSKPIGIAGMWLVLLVLTLPSIYFRPDIGRLTTEIQMGVYAGGSLVALLVMYMWFWGSAGFHWNKDTSEEDMLWLARKYAERKVGYKYTSATRITEALRYKDAAFRFVCRFRYYLGYSILGLITLNPFITYLGKRGNEVADIYIEEFKERHDDNVLEDAERKFGYGDADGIIKFAAAVAIQTIVMKGIS